MTTVKSFPPIADASARLLILGSMPGVASLNANQYYAHPRNAFWPIMQSVFHIPEHASYPEKVKALMQANVAVWDVLKQCDRVGSLDSAIKTGTRVANDFAQFLATHPYIKRILFNGAEAEKGFQTHVAKALDLTNIEMIRLPSTSPAHTLAFNKKSEAWKVAIQTL